MHDYLTLGPVFFNWAPEHWRDFYFRIADEAPIDTVVIGETVCAKRMAFFEPHLPEVIERLESAGKEVVIATLGLIMNRRERDTVAALTAIEDWRVEANDVSALAALAGRPHAIGPMINVYNEATLAFLVERGASRVTLPPELPAASLKVLAGASNVDLEVQVFGRMGLATSARCYHARAHGLHKDGCQFVCAEDPDGMTVDTLEGEAFLAVNGTQTLSYSYLNLSAEVADLKAMGIHRFRLSPQDTDMVLIATAWRDLLDGRSDSDLTDDVLQRICGDVAFSNGFFRGREGRAYAVETLEAARSTAVAMSSTT